MNWLCVLIFSLFVNGATPQPSDAGKWNTVEILCGKLVRSEEIPIKGSPNTFNERSKPIKNGILRLYLRSEETTCCEGQQPVAETVSGREGSFQFKKAAPRAYWIVARVEDKDYKLAITYAPESKIGANCSDILYAVKKGQLQLQRAVVVD